MEKTGVISFARFMELALYCPVCGYYEKEKDNLGRGGDFITSVSVGSLFGELLAFQFADWLAEVRRADCRVRIVEAGAHHGQLAGDILAWLREWRAGLFEEMEYCIVDPSAPRRERQRQALREFGGRVRWAAGLADLNDTSPGAGLCGLVFSNELLDAMPVHRIGWDAGRKEWFEWGVGRAKDRFVHVKIRSAQSGIPYPSLPGGLADLLPDEFTTEVCPAAEGWWREAAGLLRCGRLLTIDYGLSDEEFFQPERKNGTLRACHRHHLSGDVLANVGEQDLTAHVNFTRIAQAGEAAGLKSAALVSQEKFLVQIAEQAWKRPAEFGEWTPARTRQFQTLSHPEHFGRPFRVLVQSRPADGDCNS